MRKKVQAFCEIISFFYCNIQGNYNQKKVFTTAIILPIKQKQSESNGHYLRLEKAKTTIRNRSHPSHFAVVRGPIFICNLGPSSRERITDAGNVFSASATPLLTYTLLCVSVCVRVHAGGPLPTFIGNIFAEGQARRTSDLKSPGRFFRFVRSSCGKNLDIRLHYETELCSGLRYCFNNI